MVAVGDEPPKGAGDDGGVPSSGGKGDDKPEPDSGSQRPAPKAQPLAAISPEVLQQAPPEVRRLLAQITATTVSGPAPIGPDRLLDRIPNEHAADALAKIIEASKHEVDCEHATRKTEIESQDRRHLRNVILGGSAAVIVAAICVMCLLLNKDDLAKILISGLSGLVAGGFGGYGLGRSRRK